MLDAALPVTFENGAIRVQAAPGSQPIDVKWK